MEAFATHRPVLIGRQCSCILGRRVISRLPSSSGQRGTLQVVCGKGKGKKGRRTGNPRQSQQQKQGIPPTPPVDPKDEEFVLFVRSSKVPLWYPYSIMKGGWQANALVKSQENDWGKKLYSNSLKRTVAEALYKDYGEVEKSIRTNYPLLKKASQLEFGFKIRDKSKPDDWFKAVGVQALPPKEEVDKSLVDNVKEGVMNIFGNKEEGKGEEAE